MVQPLNWTIINLSLNCLATLDSGTCSQQAVIEKAEQKYPTSVGSTFVALPRNRLTICNTYELAILSLGKKKNALKQIILPLPVYDRLLRI
jgi:hypothetical protein